jgi:phosphoserine phosphatase
MHDYCNHHRSRTVERIDPPLFRGQTQLALTRQGLQEATLVAEHIASTRRPTAVCTSPLKRRKVTGAKIAQACGALPTVVEGLIDPNYGERRRILPAVPLANRSRIYR